MLHYTLRAHHISGTLSDRYIYGKNIKQSEEGGKLHNQETLRICDILINNPNSSEITVVGTTDSICNIIYKRRKKFACVKRKPSCSENIEEEYDASLLDLEIEKTYPTSRILDRIKEYHSITKTTPGRLHEFGEACKYYWITEGEFPNKLFKFLSWITLNKDWEENIKLANLRQKDSIAKIIRFCTSIAYFWDGEKIFY